MIQINTRKRSIEDYKNLISPDLYERIGKTAKRLRGLRVAEINATAKGGGVAELLLSCVPLLNSLGLKTSWYVLPPDEEFFEVTKFIHNALQGKQGELTKRQKAVYLSHTEKFAKEIAKIQADIFVIHDPQPVGAVYFLEGFIKPAVWRCHIDLSNPNLAVWDFLKPFVSQYDKVVFSMPEYVPSGFPHNKVSIFTPAIDPLNIKNKPLALKRAKKIVSFFGINPKKPLVTQVSRFDPWKDPAGVINSYKIAKKEIPDLQLALVGELASDDPEGERIYEQVKNEALSDKDIFRLCLPHSDITINAFQRASDIIIQKSIREGFGLTVTEAMWKSKAVIGGNVGGIRHQIENGKSGILVSSVSGCADAIVELIEKPELRAYLGENARERVREKFLMPRKVFDWLNIFEGIVVEAQLQNSRKDQVLLTPS